MNSANANPINSIVRFLMCLEGPDLIDANMTAELWTDLERGWASWVDVKDLTSPPWPTMCKGSMYRWRAVREPFERATMGDGFLHELVLHAKRVFHFQGTEETTEVGFQKLANACRDSPNLRMAPVNVFAGPP